MTKTAPKRAAERQDRTLEILDRERDLLLNGPLGELGALVATREALLTDVLADAGGLTEDFLHALRSRAERNGRLLLASLAGLRAAREQIEGAERSARTLRIYTASGSSVAVSEAPKTHDHRR